MKLHIFDSDFNRNLLIYMCLYFYHFLLNILKSGLLLMTLTFILGHTTIFYQYDAISVLDYLFLSQFLFLDRKNWMAIIIFSFLDYIKFWAASNHSCRFYWFIKLPVFCLIPDRQLDFEFVLLVHGGIYK